MSYSSLAIQAERLIAVYIGSWTQEQESIMKFKCGSGVFLVFPDSFSHSKLISSCEYI